MRQLVSQALTMFTSLLYKRTVIVLTLLLCSGVSAALWNMSHLSSKLIETQALQNATLYAQALNEARTLYSSDAVDRIGEGHGIIITHNYTTQDKAIPVPATYLIELGNRLSTTRH